MKNAAKFLFVGLGNIGCQAVNRAVNTMADSYPDSIRGVLLDTAKSLIDSFPPSPLLKTLFLDTSKAVRAIQMRSQSPVLDSWLPNFPMAIESGSGLFGCRALGRLAFIINIAQTAQVIKETLLELTKAQSATEELNLKIFVCASLGGGTSSAHADLAYLIRLKLEELHLPGDIIALFPYSQNMPESETASANVYAGLLELDYWMSGATYNFACDFEEIERWDIPEDENKANKRDESTAEILAKLDICLAENVSNINPGLGKDRNSSQTVQTEQTAKKSKAFLNLKQFNRPVYDLVFFNSLDKFNDDNEYQELTHTLVRLTYWSSEGNNICQSLRCQLDEAQKKGQKEETTPSYPREGNTSSSYADLHSYQIAYPAKKITAAARILSSQTVAAKLFHLFFEQDLDQNSITGTELGKDFIKNRHLDSFEVHKRYVECWCSTEGGLYDSESFIKKKLEALRQKPLYGENLVQYCQAFDKELKKLAVDCETKPEFFRALAAVTKDISDDFTVGMSNSVSDIVNRQHNGVSMQHMVEEINRQLSFSLSALHERTNSAKSEIIRLEELKNKAIDDLSSFKPSLWKKLTRQVDFTPIEEAGKIIAEYYKNVFISHVGREEVNAFFNMIGICDQTVKRLERLRSFLDESLTRLKNSNRHLYDQVLDDSNEPLISKQEAISLIAAHSAPPDLTIFVKALDQITNFNLLDLPQNYTQEEWLSELNRTVSELYPMDEPQVADEFLARYPDDKLNKKLTSISSAISSRFFYTKPANTKDTAAEKRVLVSFCLNPTPAPSGSTENRHQNSADTLSRALTKVNSLVPVALIDEPNFETIDIIEMFSGFMLSDLELSDYKDTYLSSLVRNTRAVQTRKDIKFNSLTTIDKRTYTNVVMLLASAFKFGVLQEKEGFNSANDELRLTSNKWHDLTSIKSCLKVFANPVEALLFEGNFYKELSKWRQEQINSLGINAWLKAMAPESQESAPYLSNPNSSFYKLQLNKQIMQLQGNILRDLERNWPSWKYKIAEHMKKGLDLKSAVAQIVPPGITEWLEMRWNKDTTML
ncbi:MAG: tubulin-like doman-containing protein [Candidatus Bruticola sp.]